MTMSPGLNTMKDPTASASFTSSLMKALPDLDIAIRRRHVTGDGRDKEFPFESAF